MDEGGGLYVGSPFYATGTATGIAVSDENEVVVATRAVGAMGYTLGPEVRVIDLHGLADPLTAHQRLAFRSLPGHEKLAAEAWIVALAADRPDEVTPGQFSIEYGRWPDPRPLEFLEQVGVGTCSTSMRAGRAIAGRRRRAVDGRQAFANLWHSVPNTSLRLSRGSLRQTFEAHCGESIPHEVLAFRARRHPPSSRQSSRCPAESYLGDCTSAFLGTDGAEWQPVDGPRR